MIRITTGKAKNKKLAAPKLPGYRSVQEIAKNALFSIIGNKVKGSLCLDLFAGSGNLGLEALSREARWCDFVDQNKISTKTISDNIKKCDFLELAEVHLKDAVKFAANTEKSYDLIFVDPFYEDTSQIFLMQNLEEILNEDGLITFFHGRNLDIKKVIKKTNLEVVDTRRFGKSYFSTIKKAGP